ncbi:hypothetical protein CZ794_02675 [Psychrobacter sp. JB385]|nr:hypothetical protein CZ794_02675 [Psychrobacter sp. JB385]
MLRLALGQLSPRHLLILAHLSANMPIFFISQAPLGFYEPKKVS